MNMKDRRNFERIPLKIPVEYRSKRIWQLAKIKDVSSEGAFIVTTKTDPPNTPVELFLKLNEPEIEVYIQGVVVWRRLEAQLNYNKGEHLPSGMGIRFIKVYPSLFKEFINKSKERKVIKI